MAWYHLIPNTTSKLTPPKNIIMCLSLQKIPLKIKLIFTEYKTQPKKYLKNLYISINFNRPKGATLTKIEPKARASQNKNHLGI